MRIEDIDVSEYVDIYWHFHHKKVLEGGKPSTNDGLVMTAIAKKLGFEVSRKKVNVSVVYDKYNTPVTILRNRETRFPPPSRDSILGFSTLWGKYIFKDWFFCHWEIPKFNLIETIKSAYLCLKEMKTSKKPRNVVWNYPHLYRFAFSVPLQDRDYLLRLNGEFNLFYWLIARIDQARGSDTVQSQLLRFIKYDEMPDIKTFFFYFGKDHPFTMARAIIGHKK
jgi:hypothetical protein